MKNPRCCDVEMREIWIYKWGVKELRGWECPKCGRIQFKDKIF